MKKFAKKFAVIALAAMMATATFTGCGPKATGTIVVATGEMNGVFSPFFATTSYDRNISDLAHATLIKAGRQAEPLPALADFEIEEIEKDGEVAQTVYTFTLKDKVKFSDGTAITSDDIIFNYYVYADPTYDGSATFKTLNIPGMKDYTEGTATTIEGIEKVDNKTVRITLDGVDPSAIWKIGGIAIAPQAYYGEGFVKGDLSGVRAKNGMPMGAGPYKFESYENNVVTLVANEDYYLGAPHLARVMYQVTDTAALLESVKLGQTDIADPSASPEMVKQVEDAGLHYELVENLGYGYVGINAERVSDINVRKGLMHLMNRRPAVDAYYGELAEVMERPMSTVSWAYPQGATEYYGFNPQKALEYFKAAGYEEVNGRLVKDGKQLRLEVGIPAGGTMEHPTAPVLTQMKTELEKMGGVLEISDTDGSIFFDRLTKGDWDIWAAAWSASIDPDMIQVYHSNGPSNHYKVKNEKLDQIITAARLTNDIEERKAYYSEALDIIMDEAVEMPIYQRKNMFVINQEMVDISTLPKDMTPYYTYFAEIETLKAMAQ